MSSRYRRPERVEPRELLPVKLLRGVLVLYLFLLLVVQPFYYHDAYNDIGSSKWDFYAHISFGSVRYPFVVTFPGFQLVLLGLWIWFAALCASKGAFREVFDPRKLTVPDWFVIAYMVATVLSALLAPDKSVVLWGFPGWYMGMVAQLSFGWLYFLVSRFLWDRRIWTGMVLAMAGVMCAVGLIGVINRFGFDLLGLYHATWDSVEDIRKLGYISTIGNPGWYAVWLSVMFPAGAYFILRGKKLWQPIVGIAATIIGAMALLLSGEAAAVSGLGVVTLVLFLVAFRENTLFRRFWLWLSTWLLAAQLLRLLILWVPEEHRPALVDELASHIIHGWWTTVAAVLSVAVLIGLTLGKRRGRELPEGQLLRAGRILGWSVLAVFALGLAYLLLNSAGKLPAAIASDAPYLNLNRDWGSHRFFIWEMTLACFREKWAADPARLLFGMGPDSCYQIYEGISDALNEQWSILAERLRVGDGNYLANAHNEWLNLFVTEGILGGASYLGLFAASFVSSLRRLRTEPLKLFACAAIAMYAANTVFSYQQAMGAPYAFVAAAVGMGAWSAGEEG